MKKWVLISLLVVMVLVWITTSFIYHKQQSAWGGINIFVWATLISALVYWMLSRFEYFQDPWSNADTWMIWTLAGAFVLVLFLGIHFTEPIASENVGFSTGDTPYHYNYGGTRTGLWLAGFRSSGTNASNTSLGSLKIKSSGKDSGKALAVLAILAIVVLIIFGSAVFPHFWVVGLLIIISITLKFTIREFEVDP